MTAEAIQAKIKELEGKITAVCVSCGHGQWISRKLVCNRKRSPCHSKRVGKWLSEIKRLEGG